MLKRRLVFIGLLVAGALSACGGGGDNDDDGPTAVTSTAEGAYVGTISNTSYAASFNSIVLGDGQIWTLYGNDVGGTFAVLGLIQGQGTSNNGSYTSSTAKDFGLVPARAITINATYAADALTGTMTDGASTVSFNGAAPSAAAYKYDTPASLSSVVGNWSMSMIDGTAITVAIEASGAFTSIDANGCNRSGTLTPQPSGKSIFNVQLANGPAPCPTPGLTGGGIGAYTTLANGSHQLIVAVVDLSRTYGTAVFGSR